MKNLVFSVTYKSHFEQGKDNVIVDKLGVTRDYESIYKGLRITEFSKKGEQK